MYQLVEEAAKVLRVPPLEFDFKNPTHDPKEVEQNNAGANEMLMPTIQSSDLWVKSGRYDDYGKEMLRIKDRSGREMLYGPTNEELITDIFQTYITSYKIGRAHV